MADVVAVASFPLHRLQNDAIRKIIQIMPTLDMLSYSLLSDKSKNLTASLPVHSRKLCLLIFPARVIITMFMGNNAVITIRPSENQEPGNLISQPENIQVDHYTQLITHRQNRIWRNPGLSLRKMLEHCLSVFRFPNAPLIAFPSTDEMIRLEDIRDNFMDLIQFTCIEQHSSTAYNRRLFQVILPVAKKIVVQPRNETAVFLPLDNFSIQNLDSFWSANHLTLEQVLVSNASVIISTHESHHQKDINRFLKSWIRGSNSRMEFIKLHTARLDNPDENIILKGVTYRNVSQNEFRVMQPSLYERKCTGLWQNQEHERLVVRGGYEIRNRYGICATVHLVADNDGSRGVAMFVWR